MTVSNISPVATGDGNGSTTDWPFSFRIDRAEDIDVILTDANGDNRLLSPAEYDVLGVFPGTGSVVYPRAGSSLPPLSVGYQLTRRRRSELTQAVDLLAGGEFSAPVVEAMTDRVVMALQELVGEVERAVRLPVQVDPSIGEGDPGTPVVLPAPPVTPQFLQYSLADGLALSGTPDLPLSMEMHGGDYLRVAASETGYEFIAAALVLDNLLSTLTGGGFLVHDGAGNAVQRTITGTADEIQVTNGAGIAGDPVIALPPLIDLTAKQVDVATQVLGDNSPAVASTSFVQAAVFALIDSAPETLDTLKELADAINNDPALFDTIVTALATKLNVGDNLSDLADVPTALVNLGFNDPVFDKTAPGDIGATTPAQGDFTNLNLTGDVTLAGGLVEGRDIGADGAVLDALLNLSGGGKFSAPGNTDNVALNAFRVSTEDGRSRLGLVAGLVDNFTDQSAIDQVANAQHGVLAASYSPGPLGYGSDLTGGGLADASAGIANNAFDDDPGTATDFGTDTPGTIDYDFGPGAQIAAARVSFIFTDGNPASSGETVRLWSSDDGIDWSLRATDTMIAQANGVDAHVIDIAGAPQARFWRWQQVSVFAATSGGAREISWLAATGGQDMLIISQSLPGGVPGEPVSNNVRAVLFGEPVDGTPLETGLALWARRDDGSTVTTDFAQGNKWLLAGHGFGDGDRVTLTSAVSLPQGAVTAALYHVVGATENDFELSLSPGGPAITLTGDGIGIHTVYRWLAAALENQGSYDPGRQALAGDIDFAGTPTGNTLTWALETSNGKRVNIHGVALIVQDPVVGMDGSGTLVGASDHADNIALGAFRTAFLGGIERLGLAGGFVDAFTGEDGTAGRSGGVFDPVGNFFQSSGAETSEDGGHLIDPGNGLGNATTIDRTWSIDNGATVTRISVYSVVSTIVTVKIVHEDNSSQYDVLVSESFAHQGTGWETHTLIDPFVVPATDIYRVGIYASVNISRTPNTVDHARIEANIIGDDVTGFLLMTWHAHLARVWYRGAAEPMTVVTESAVVADVADQVRAVLFQEDIDPVALNSDLIIWATRDDGRAVTTDFVLGNRWTSPAHGLFDGDRVTVASDGTLPAGVETGRLYYVVNSDPSSIELSLLVNGAAIILTDDGIGAHNLRKWTQGVLEETAALGTPISGWRMLAATVDLSLGAPGTTMALCAEIPTPVLMTLHGAALLPPGGGGFDIASLQMLGAAPELSDTLALFDTSTGLTRQVQIADLPSGGGATAGAGLVDNGGAIDVGVHADGSIVVNTDTIQVGTINDSQHGSRGGGGLHGEATGALAGFMAAADKLKLTGITPGATPDQTGAGIKALYEGELDTNAFTDAAQAKLAGLPADAAGDQTGAEIKALYEGELDTNAFTDAAQAKLAGLPADAAADQSGAEIKALYEAEANTNAYGDADLAKLAAIAPGADVTDEASVRAALAGALGDVAINGQKLTGVGNGTNAGDAVNKGQLDGVINGIVRKANARLVATGNIVLTGEQTIDGVLTAASRVLLTGQTAASENGPYLSAAGAWIRSLDFDSDADIANGAAFFVEQGAAQADTQWLLTTNAPIVLDTTPLTFEKIPLVGATVGDGIGIDITGDLASLIATGVKTSYESNADTNGYSDAEKALLATVAAGAQPDQTGAEIKALYEGELDTNAFTDAEQVKLAAIAAGAQPGTVTQVATSGLAQGGPITGNGTVNVPVADQAGAEAGTDDAVAMTPLKTAQAIDAHLLPVMALTGIGETLSPAQNNAVLSLDNAAAITLTLPNDLGVGFNVVVRQGLAGQVAFAPAVGASAVNVDGHIRTRGQWALVSVLVVENIGGSAAQYTIAGGTAP